MKPARDLPQPEGVDLARLNAAEREALHLLAEGHTAKTIASRTGRSVGAINERLREARRKTGVGSSRELARLLKDQKSRDEQIGVALQVEGGASTDSDAARSGASGAARKGSLIVATLVIAAIAATALLLQGPPRDPLEVKDPLLGGMFQSAGSEPRQLYRLVRTEARDADWAARAEALLKTRYAPLFRTGRVDSLRVICAATVCEVAGAIPGKEAESINATMQTLQDAEINMPITEVGIKHESASFGSGPGPEVGIFAAYWLRSA